MADYSGIYQVWTAQFDLASLDVEDKEKFPAGFKLYQNYPNPFNPETKIQYSVDRRQFISLKIYNILGKDVASLVNEEKSAGVYDVKFYSANLPSGIYFYQLKAGEFSETKKMILLK